MAPSVGRFQVMALLQAARAYSLGLPLGSAHSWGLNRAIFYAAAKRGFVGRKRARGKGVRMGRETVVTRGRPSAEERAGRSEEYHLGDEVAFRDKKDSSRDKPIFMIGGEPQTEESFERRVEVRFGDHSSFKEAWNEALDYVKNFAKEVLLSRSRFFSDVYRPKRDEFANKWTEMSSSGAREAKKKILKIAPTTTGRTKKRT